eukprot:scaffold130207_cov32-Tisochrysis_lutea.AAC.6
MGSAQNQGVSWAAIASTLCSGDRARMSDPNCLGSKTPRPCGRPLPARSCRHVQECGPRRASAEPLRKDGVASGDGEHKGTVDCSHKSTIS